MPNPACHAEALTAPVKDFSTVPLPMRLRASVVKVGLGDWVGRPLRFAQSLP